MPLFVRASLQLAIFATLILGPLACVSDDGASGRDDQNEQDIVSGKTASSYSEAVLVDLYRGGVRTALCSGSLIAPKVVLTAGHCVHGWDAWQVEAPFADGQTASSNAGSTYDWTAEGEQVNPDMHDIGLVFLSSAITLKSYPAVPSSPVAFGSKVENLGRIHNGQPSFTELYMGKSVTVTDGEKYGFPFAYSSTDIIESGDSGGPVIKPGTHEIVAVNSGAGYGLQVLARTDLLASWIQKEIDAHGGSGASSSAKAPSGCGSLSFAGECSGNTVKWCENDQAQSMSCTKEKQTCKYDATNKYYNCL